jgi:hypothetical protein
MNNLYLDDYSSEDIIQPVNNNICNDIEEVKNNKPSVSMKSDYNSRGEKIVLFRINIPLKKENEALTIDILINDEMYKNIGKHF